MTGRAVLVWHPESPGVSFVVFRPWWRRKRRPFATIAEVSRWHALAGVPVPIADVRR